MAKSRKSKIFPYKRKRKAALRVAEEQAAWTPTTLCSRPASRIQLKYEGKMMESELLRLIPEASLEEIKSFGQMSIGQSPNLLIWGDNLLAMRWLLEHSGLANWIRVVYIDPPFATGQEFKIGNSRTSTISSSDRDAIAYRDDLTGPAFLEFLRHRLILLRELLADDGSIYVHIDCKMGHYVKVLMDEIFGQGHFISDISRIKCNPKNFARRGFGNVKDMILFYSKSRHYVWNEPRAELSEEDIIRLFPKIDEQGRRYTTTPLHAPGETKNGDTGQQWNGLFPPPGRHWRIARKELTKLERAGLIEWSRSGNPRKKIYADEVLAKGKKIQDVWELKDPPYPTYPTEKNLEMLRRIISASSNPRDIILDCFSGSGTTLIAAEQLGRRWVGIDNSQLAVDKTIQRLTDISRVSSFVVYKCVQQEGQNK